MRRLALWLVMNVQLPGWIAPWMFGYAMGRRTQRVRCARRAARSPPDDAANSETAWRDGRDLLPSSEPRRGERKGQARAACKQAQPWLGLLAARTGLAPEQRAPKGRAQRPSPCGMQASPAVAGLA